MTGFTLPITLPLSWQSARSAQFWAGQDRRIYARFYVSRPDGVTWTDLTSYLVSARISLGNVADVGTGNSGVDTGVRQATFELINDRPQSVLFPFDDSLLSAYGLPAALSRSSVAYLSDGTQIAANVPRFEVGKFGRAVMVEEGTTQKYTNSELTSLSGWSTPDPNLTATLYGETYGGSGIVKLTKGVVAPQPYMSFRQGPASTKGNTYTCSFKCKMLSGGTVQQRIRVHFNGSNIAPNGMLDLGDGWWLLWYTGQAVGTVLYSGISIVGDDACEVLFTQPLLEEKAYCTSYHPSTRSPETLTIPTAGALSQQEGTVECYIKLLRAPGTNEQCIFDGAGAANQSLELVVRTDGKLEARYGTGTSAIAITSASALAKDVWYKVACRWSQAGMNLLVDDTVVASSATAPSLSLGTNVYIGSRSDGTLQLDGLVDNLLLWPRNDSLHPRDRLSSWNQWGGIYAPLLWPTREVVLEVAAVPIGATPGPADWVRVFHGFMGDSISASSDNGRIVIECRDLMKRLQDTYIETVREYGSEAGTPAEAVMQQIINDNVANPPTLYVPVSPGFMITPYKCEYQSVADALWQIANQFGGWIGYRWIPDYNDFRLTLLIPPRGKDAASADWALDWSKDILVQHLDISDRDVRNAVVVTYRDAATGTRQSVTVEDAASIAEFGRRAMQIEEADTSLIDTSAEATALAQVVVHDLKDLTAATRINMPFMPTMDVFDGILITNPRLSSTQDFYAVESVEHVLDFDRGQFRTEVVASGRVVGAHTRWLLMETRPGSPGQPIPKTPKYRLIVAAKDSPYEERRNADYFCDGVADQEQINAAVAALGSAGGEVLLLKGTYIVSDSILLCSNVSLTGQGTGTTVRTVNGATTNFSIIRNSDLLGGNTDISISDLRIDGNLSQVSNVQIGIYLKQVKRAYIGRVSIANCTAEGIDLDSSSECRIASCAVEGCNSDGIRTYNSTGCTVTGCTLARNGGGILTNGGTDLAINGNVCTEGRLYGIWTLSPNTTVAGNVCTNNGQDGIILTTGANNATVTGNTCKGNAYSGIYLSGVSGATLVGNTLKANNRHGIYLIGSSNNNVQGNTCDSNSQSAHNTYDNIQVDNNSDYNNLQNNICRRGTGANQPRYGIRINTADCDGNVVTNNDLYQSGASGSFSDAGTGTVTTAGNRI